MSVLADPARLKALEASGLLRKSVPERVQHLVYTAYSLLKADAAMLNILTPDTQHTVYEWPRTAPRAIPVADSGCLGVLLSGETLAVEDTRDHPTLCVMPWTACFRGYLGTAVSYHGQVVGTLCAFTIQGRDWTPLDNVTVESLARLASLSLEEGA